MSRTKSTTQEAVSQPPRSLAPNGCGMKVGPGSIEGGAVSMDVFARTISGLAGGQVTDRTGLEGRYDLTLRFMPPRPAPNAPTDGDARPFAQALQEQLGLTLYSEKTTVKVFVVDRLERPTLDQEGSARGMASVSGR